MKIQTIVATLFAGGLLLGLSACSKEEVKDSTTKAVDATKNAADKAATAVNDTTEKAVEATKEATTKAGDAVKDAATTTTQATKEQTDAAKSAVANASADVAAALGSAKKLATEGKWQEAAKALEPLGSVKLTPEQQSLLDQLKKQIAQLQSGSQKLTDDATKTVGDLLKK